MELISQKLNDIVEENKRIEAALRSNNEDQHNTNLLFGEALELADKAEQKAMKLERRCKNAVIGFAICGTGTGIGTGIMTAGIIKNDIGMTLSGAGIDLLSIGVWFLGHYAFEIF